MILSIQNYFCYNHPVLQLSPVSPTPFQIAKRYRLHGRMAEVILRTYIIFHLAAFDFKQKVEENALWLLREKREQKEKTASFIFCENILFITNLQQHY